MAAQRKALEAIPSQIDEWIRGVVGGLLRLDCGTVRSIELEDSLEPAARIELATY
jgi:hypothetical protein